MKLKTLIPLSVITLVLTGLFLNHHEASQPLVKLPQKPKMVRYARDVKLSDYGVVGDGKTDVTAAIQKLVDAPVGVLRFPTGQYRLTKPVVIDLNKVGPTSISGDGTATILMEGAGPAFHFIGTHNGTASPKTVQPVVWEHVADGRDIYWWHLAAW